jgi:hypothetical protein
MALANGGVLLFEGHVRGDVCQGERCVAYYPSVDFVAWLSIPRRPGFVRRRAFLQRLARRVVEACFDDMIVFVARRVPNCGDET